MDKEKKNILEEPTVAGYTAYNASQAFVSMVDQPYSIDELHERIKRSEMDMAAGRVTPHDELMLEMKKRFDL